MLGHGHEQKEQPKRPSKVPGIAAEQIAAGWKHSAAVTNSGKLYTWGWGGSQGEPGADVWSLALNSDRCKQMRSCVTGC